MMNAVIYPSLLQLIATRKSEYRNNSTYYITGPKGNMEFCQSWKKTAKKSFAVLAGSQICCGFKKNDLITCESKVVVVSLGSC